MSVRTIHAPLQLEGGATSGFPNKIIFSPGSVLTDNGDGTFTVTFPSTGISIGSTITGGTDGSVLFINPAGTLAQDNANFFFDNTNNRLALLNTSPAYTLSIGSSGQFGVNSSGAIAAATGIASSGTINFSGLTASLPVFTDASKNLTNTGTVPVGNGGTGATSFTAGSVIFSNGTILTQDNSNFFWDDSNNRLGIGTTSPSGPLHILKSIGDTTTDGVVVENTTAVASGAAPQQWSPRLRLGGRGWSGSASQSIDFIQEVVPVSGGTGYLAITGIVGGVQSGTAYIGTDGFIGVGTVSSSPLAPLHFNSTLDGVTTEAMRLQNSGIGASGTYATFYGGSSEDGRITVVSNTMAFGTGSSGTRRMLISSSGIITFDAYTTNGGLFFANGSGVVSQTGAGTSTTILHGGTTPSYSAVSLTADISGTLGVGNGGTGTSTTFTTGSVVFAGASGVYSQDNANLFWDDTNNFLGIGTTAPTVKTESFISSGGLPVTSGTSQTFGTIRNRAGTLVLDMGVHTTGAGWLQSSNSTNLAVAYELLLNPRGGNVGINSTSAQAQLEIKGVVPSAGSRPTTGIYFTTPNNANVRGQIGLIQSTSEGNHYLVLQSVEDGVAWRNVVLARDGGNVGIGTASPSEILDVSGNVQLKTSGNGFKVKEGTNATMGVATMVAGTVTVSTTKVTASSRIFLTPQNASGTAGSVSITARTASTSFVISSTNILDTRDVAWLIMEPA